MAHLRQAIAQEDRVLAELIRLYLIVALASWLAIVSFGLTLGPYLLPEYLAYLAYVAWIPGYQALPAIVIGPDCAGGLLRAQVTYAAGLAAILLCWCLYFLIVAPRYLGFLRRLSPKVVAAAKGDVTLDFGWSRRSYRFATSSVAALYLALSLLAMVDTLLHPHLVQWACAQSWLGATSARFQWLGYHWLLLELIWCGLAVLAPHALLLLDQAWVMTHGGRRRRTPAKTKQRAAARPDGSAETPESEPAQPRRGRHTVERETGFADGLFSWGRKPRPAASRAAASRPVASQPKRQAPPAEAPLRRQRSGKAVNPSLEQIFADMAKRWQGEAIQAMRANDHYPTDHMATSGQYYAQLAKAARKLRGQQRQARQSGQGDEAALLRAERELAQKAHRQARRQLDGLAEFAPERSAAQDIVDDLAAHIVDLDRRLGQSG